MTKYIIATDHRAGFNDMDKIIELDAKSIMDAMDETYIHTGLDDELYCVCLYERIAKNTYRQIMRSDDGHSFHTEKGIFDIKKYSEKAYGKKIEWFEFIAK